MFTLLWCCLQFYGLGELEGVQRALTGRRCVIDRVSGFCVLFLAPPLAPFALGEGSCHSARPWLCVRGCLFSRQMLSANPSEICFAGNVEADCWNQWIWPYWPSRAACRRGEGHRERGGRQRSVHLC